MLPLSIKNTDELQQELMETPDLERFLQENEQNFKSCDITALINEMFNCKGISRAELAKRSGMSEVYLYQLVTGRRYPSRSRMLCLCVGANATLAETQRILQQCGFATLYPANRRDAIIIYGLLHEQSLFELNDCLFTANEETLF